MKTFSARELLSLTPDQVWQTLPEKFKLSFDDGQVIDATNKNTLYSRFFWKIHENFSKTPIKASHHVTHVLKGKSLTSSTHIQLLKIIFKDACSAHQLERPEQKEPLLSLVYDVANDIQNQVNKYAEPYVTSIDILDFIEVVEHPLIKAANDSVEPTDESIYKTYDKIFEVINNDRSLGNNSLVRAIKSKMVNFNQVVQCISNRGFVTEVDGSILKVPVLTNFTRGVNTLYSFIAESRSAAKASYFSEAPLQDAEYFARRLQLMSMVVENIDHVDCGTIRHMQWRMKPPVTDEKGNVIYPGDLKFMLGKYYLDEETNDYKEIKGDESYLYDRLVKFRSVLLCEHKDPHSVCAMCFGGLANNVSRFANLGHLCSATMTQQTSQSVLSTKHLDASSRSSSISLSEYAAKYLSVNRAKNAYLIRKELKDKDVRIVIDRDSAVGLTDVINIENFDNINPVRISSIESLDLVYKFRGEEHTVSLTVNQGKRRANLTAEFLKYLKTYRWETDARNNFVFSLHNWDFSIPIMKLPDMEYSFSDHSKEIAKLIESSMKNIADREKPDSPMSTLQELFDLVNSKLFVNIAALEIIIYTSMIAGKDNYGLARGSPNPKLGVGEQLVYNRSLSAAYAYEKHNLIIPDPKSFFKLNRPSSVFDVFIAPNAVVQEHKQKQGRI